MVFKSLIPHRDKGNVPENLGETHPFHSLQTEVNRLMHEFWHDFHITPFGALESFWGSQTPKVDVTETDKAIQIAAELPGMDEKDIELTLTEDTLILKGEKKEEKETKNKDYYHVERAYGRFHRTFHLPKGIKTTNVEAVFKNGLLTISLPKTKEAKREAKKIDIKTE